MSSATVTQRTGAGGGGVKKMFGSKWGQRGLAVSAIAFAAILPLFLDSGGGWMGDLTVTLAYVIMALGLNVVVGFAGLLDLGYVAFYALGAYTLGWFASSHFAEQFPKVSTSLSTTSSRTFRACTSTS